MSLLKTLALLGIISMILEDCDSFDSLSEEKFKKNNWTQEQSEVGTAIAYRRPFTEEVKQEDGTEIYKITYGGITEEDVLISVRSTHQDLEEILNSELDVPTLKYFQKTGMGEHLVKQERIYNYLEDTLTKAVLHKKFLEFAQQQTGSSYDPLNVSESDKYSITTIFPINQKEMEFDIEYVQSARSSGKLKDQSNIVESLLEEYSFFEKVQNPKYPRYDKYNEWIFKKRTINLLITSYNLDNDPEMEADYIELFRVKPDKTKESMPAIKVFKPNGTGPLEVLVADKDVEGVEGFGIPDLVEREPITTGIDLLYSYATEFIFKDSKKEKPYIPEESNPDDVYVVRTGTVLAEKYDINPTGWESYLPNYKSGKNAKKFSVHIKLTGEDEDETRNIEWIAKQYPDTSRTIEFFKPNDTFEGESYSQIKTNGNLVSAMDETGQIKQYNVDALIEDKPFRIDFDKNKQKRWTILDQDDDREHYEAKKEVTYPESVIPELKKDH